MIVDPSLSNMANILKNSGNFASRGFGSGKKTYVARFNIQNMFIRETVATCLRQCVTA